MPLLEGCDLGKPIRLYRITSPASMSLKLEHVLWRNCPLAALHQLYAFFCLFFFFSDGQEALLVAIETANFCLVHQQIVNVYTSTTGG